MPNFPLISSGVSGFEKDSTKAKLPLGDISNLLGLMVKSKLI